MASSPTALASMTRAVVVGGWRTPFVKAGTDFADLDVLDLAKVATAETLARTETAARDVDEVVYGNVSRPVAYHNLAREIVLALGLPTEHLRRERGHGLRVRVRRDHDGGRSHRGRHRDLGARGRRARVSRTSRSRTRRSSRGPSCAHRRRRRCRRSATSFADVRLADLAPVAPGIRETSTGLTMGQSAELMAKINGITREEQDRWALRSQPTPREAGRTAGSPRRSRRCTANGRSIAADGHIRRDTTLEKLGTLRPVFDRTHGTITAGNASPLTDGAATVLLMSEDERGPRAAPASSRSARTPTPRSIRRTSSSSRRPTPSRSRWSAPGSRSRTST